MYRLLAYIPEALESIWRHRTRSLLSALGMIIGIASVIAVLGLSQAGANGLKQQIAQGGDPGYIAIPDPSQNNPAAATLYYRDAAIMQAYSGGVIGRAIPFYQQREQRIVTSGKSEFITIASTYPMTTDMGFVVDSGRLIDTGDVASAANVGVMTTDAAQKLFPSGAQDRSLNVGTQRLLMVGVVSLKVSLFRGFLGETIWIPYTTMHRIAPGPIDFILFWPADKSTTSEQVSSAAKAALKRIHSHGQYAIQDRSAFLGVFEKVLSSIGVGLTFIGGIALFVAGIGIMNIMLVSVTERTREIGIRKSIGANSSDIALQFLIEAVLLSLGGGAIGSALGVLFVLLGRGAISQSVGAAPVPWALVLTIAAGFSLAVGIGFGFYPATRAARMDPVEALRS